MAYKNDSIISCILTEGEVQIMSEGIEEKTTLQPNQQFQYNKNNNKGQVESVDASIYTSWINGYYYFPEQRLELILHRLSNIYGINITINSELLKNKVFTGTFYRGQSMKSILEILNTSVPIRYTINELNVTISDY